jgi:hypothetical protein
LSKATTRHPGRFAMRSLAACAVATTLLGSTIGATAAASTSATTSSRLSFSADPMTVHVGSTILLSGTATPRTSVPVYLQRYVAGHWKTLGHHVTTSTGAYKFTVKAPGKPTTWIFRVVRATGASHTVHVKISASSFRVKAATTAQVTAGTPVVVTGSVSPKASGPVRLQILRGKTWTTLTSAKLTSRSTFTLSASRPAGAYRLRVVKPFTSTIAAGVSATKTVAVVVPPQIPVGGSAGTPRLAITSADDPLLALPASRLVFSAVRDQALPPAKAFTVTNTGTAAATVSGLAISGTDATSFALAAGQPGTVVVPAGGQASIAIQFTPTAPTNCPPNAAPPGVSGSNRYASLVFSTTDPALPSGAATLAGLISCDLGGPSEPVLHQIVQTFGYTSIIDTPAMDPRYLTSQAAYPGTDEIMAPYFRAADPSAPVTMTPLAHYSSPLTTPYHATGWYPRGAAIPGDGSCATTCQTFFQFPADPSTSTYNQNQKLLPTTTGTQAFSTTGTFGLFAGDGKDVVFSDDHYNTSVNPHDVRVYTAFGPGHVAIPNTYLVAIDTGRGGTDPTQDSKNHDFQDIVMVVRNVVPTS